MSAATINTSPASDVVLTDEGARARAEPEPAPPVARVVGRRRSGNPARSREPTESAATGPGRTPEPAGDVPGPTPDPRPAVPVGGRVIQVGVVDEPQSLGQVARPLVEASAS